MSSVAGPRSAATAGSAQVLPLVLGAVSDVVFQTGRDGRVEWMSPSVTDVLGYDPGDLVGEHMIALLHDDDAARVREALHGVPVGTEVEHLRVRLRTAAGSWREVVARVRPLLLDGGVAGALVTLRDEHEAAATRRALATVMAGNAVLVRAETAQQLLDEMCAAIVSAGGYAFCWYGRCDHDETRAVTPVAVGGDDRGYVATIRVSWDAESPLGRGPTGECIRTGTTQVRSDLAADPLFWPWLDEATGRGIHCSISLPVFVDGVVDGALMVYATEAGTFGTLAQEMLEGLAADLGYGLQRVRDVELRLQAEERFRLIAENATDVVFLADTALTWQWISPSAETVLGWPAEELVGCSGVDYVHPDDVAALQQRMREVGAEHPLTMRLRFRQRDGSYRWMSAAGRGIVGPDGEALGRVVSMRDVSTEVRKEEDLAASEARFRLLAEHALDVVVRSDERVGITWVSPSATEVLGWRRAEVIGRTARGFVHPDDLAAVLRAGHDEPVDSAVLELRVAAKDGSWRWMRDAVSLVRDDSGRVTVRIDTLRDIDREVSTRTRLAYATDHDPLTALLNRRGLFATLEGRFAADVAWPVALLAVGVDGLAAINAAFTHTAADRVLVQVAHRLTGVVADRNRLARSADNEFSVVVEGGDAAAVSDLAAAIVSACSHTAVIGTHDIPVTVSVGIAMTERPDAGELVRDASTALHQVRDAGGNRWDFLDPTVAEAARRRLTVVSGLHHALTTAELRPWFQPIVRLSDAELLGYEALVRWVRQDGTVMPPADFLPVAEQSGLIVAIDHAVLAAAVDTLVRLPADQHLSVNVAAATLAADGLVEKLRHELNRSGVAPYRLQLEVTETSLVRVTQHVLNAMRTIAGLGVTWWVDDFGTGYSSISHLRDMPIAGLKLDRSFTAGLMHEDPTHRRLAQGLIGLAQGLGLDTIAEGVETREQADLLAAQGWRCAQGYLYGAPAPM